MTMNRAVCRLPRPWYISLTAVWQDDRKADARHRELDKMLTDLKRLRMTSPYQLAGNHILVGENCRHFTVLAVMKINGLPDGAQDMRQFSGRVFEPIRNARDLLRDLRAKFTPFTAKAVEVRCFDNGMTLQFECGKALGEFRDHARRILTKPVLHAERLHTNSAVGRRFIRDWGVPLVDSILDDPKKNYGTGAFGSVTRSPCRCDGSTERWRVDLREIDAEFMLKFRRLHLLVSDEMLTNPRGPEEDVLI